MKKIVALVLSLVMVLGLATTAFAVDAELYSWSDGEKKWVEMDWNLTGDLEDQTLDYDDGFLPCYTANGKYFVETTEAAALWKMVYGAKTVYLTEVAEKLVKFEDKASVLKVVAESDATCGDYYVADAAYDEDAVYYVAYNKNGTVKQIYVATKGANTNVLVDGKLVAVETAAPTQLKHDWKGYDVVNYAYTTVKCANCGKVAPLFANADAAGKNAEKVEGGWITAAANGYTAAGAATTTDKVTSAQTFDAGIAMYVGMSVMAAAGSAVVLKKKD